MKKILLALLSILTVNLQVKAEEEIRRVSFKTSAGFYLIMPYYQIEGNYLLPSEKNNIELSASISNLNLPLSSLGFNGKYYFNKEETFQNYGVLGAKIFDNCMYNNCVGKNGVVLSPLIGIGSDLMFSKNIGLNLELNGILFAFVMPMPDFSVGLKIKV